MVQPLGPLPAGTDTFPGRMLRAARNAERAVRAMSNRGLDDPDALGTGDLVERPGELAVPIADQELDRRVSVGPSKAELRAYWVTQLATGTARSVNVTTHVLEPRGSSYQFLTGSFYPIKRWNSRWGFLFRFSDQSVGITFEEDIPQVNKESPCPDSLVKISTGRTIYYSSLGVESSARFFVNRVFYSVYLRGPVLHIGGLTAVRKLLFAFLDSLRQRGRSLAYGG